MRKFLSLMLISVFTWSCTKEEVKLPINGISGIQEPIYDNTQIWMFYKMKDGKPTLTLNKNNKISTTNWVFNIDRRLPMRLVAPSLEKVVNGRKITDDDKDKPIVFNYFSYADTLRKKISTVKFNRITYRTVTEFPLIEKANDSLNEPVQIMLKESGLTVHNNVITPEELAQYLATKTAPELAIQLYLDGNISYGDYLAVKAILAPYQPVDELSNPTEYLVLN
ncbi:hypothetical protein MWU59_08440 [Flavobacteriaceae bacterium F08102]|nr:hypothetical protein [Flavobacteriaceae bacterium F08102]